MIYESRDIAIDILIKQIIKVFKEINFKNFETCFSFYEKDAFALQKSYNNIELSLY